jgi:GxxExxY protein
LIAYSLSEQDFKNYKMDRISSGVDELTHKIIGCAMQVHNTLGNGFQEVIYQRALAIELAYKGLSFEREKEMPIHYRDRQIGTRRVDFFVRIPLWLS